MDREQRLALMEGLLDELERPEVRGRQGDAIMAWLVGVETAVADEIKQTPIPMRITCPECGALHIDEGVFATKPHHTHSCQACGLTWRPAVVPTVGVRFLPGFKNEEPKNG